jgi:hypothetical protein
LAAVIDEGAISLSSSDLRFDMTIGQPSATAPMNLESGRSIEWVSESKQTASLTLVF